MAKVKNVPTVVMEGWVKGVEGLFSVDRINNSMGFWDGPEFELIIAEYGPRRGVLGKHGFQKKDRVRITVEKVSSGPTIRD
jgi:hypothetical protein